MSTATETAPSPRFVSIAEAARLLGISRPHAYAMVDAGQIPTVSFGHRKVVPLRWIDDLAEKAASPGDD